MPSVLFVCTGNQYRSPIAAAYLRRALQQRGLAEWAVESAGTWTLPGQRLFRDAERYAAKLGVNVQGQSTRLVSGDMPNMYDLILVMEKGHKEALNVEFPSCRGRVYLLTEMLEGEPVDIRDPITRPDEHYRILRDMCDLIERAVPRIIEVAVSSGSRT